MDKDKKGKCLICGILTINKINSHRICDVCFGKFGSWENIKDKLKQMGITFIKRDNEIEPKEKNKKLIKNER